MLFWFALAPIVIAVGVSFYLYKNRNLFLNTSKVLLLIGILLQFGACTIILFQEGINVKAISFVTMTIVTAVLVSIVHIRYFGKME